MEHQVGVPGEGADAVEHRARAAGRSWAWPWRGPRLGRCSACSTTLNPPGSVAFWFNPSPLLFGACWRGHRLSRQPDRLDSRHDGPHLGGLAVPRRIWHHDPYHRLVESLLALSALWLSSVVWFPALGLVPLLFLLFPDGSLPSPRWRPVAGIAVASMAVEMLAVAFSSGPIGGELLPGTPQNPVGIESARSWSSPGALASW